MPSDSTKTKVIIEQRVYRNAEIASWIESEFPEGSREVAWKTVFQIAKMFPEVGDRIRGELIDSDIQEEQWASL